MAIIKPSKKILDRLEKEEVSIRKNLASIEIFSSGIKTKFWETIYSKQTTKLEELNRQIDDELNKLSGMNKDLLIKLVTSRNTIRDFVSINDYVKAKDTFKKLLEKKQDEISKYKSRLSQ